MDDEFRTLRRRQEDLRQALDRKPRGRSGTAKFVGAVFDGGSMPTTVPGQFAVHPTALGGTESEGGAIGATDDTSRSRIVTVLGPGVPSVGDRLRARLIGGRWVAERGGAGAPTTVFCGGCHIPTSLTFTCNGKSFTLTYSSGTLWGYVNATESYTGCVGCSTQSVYLGLSYDCAVNRITVAVGVDTIGGNPNCPGTNTSQITNFGSTMCEQFITPTTTCSGGVFHASGNLLVYFNNPIPGFFCYTTTKPFTLA